MNYNSEPFTDAEMIINSLDRIAKNVSYSTTEKTDFTLRMIDNSLDELKNGLLNIETALNEHNELLKEQNSLLSQMMDFIEGKL